MPIRSCLVLAFLFLVNAVWAAVSSEVSRTDYVGNGSVAAYATTYPVKATTEVLVFTQDADGQDVELTLGADYSAVLSTAGLCTITLTAGNLTSGYKISLQRGIPYTQTYNPAQSGAYNAASLGTALDRLNMEIIRLKGDVDRAIKIPYLEAGGDSVTKLDDNAASRANQAVVFDASGNAMVGGTVGVSASAFAQTILDDTSADAARTTLGLPSQAMAVRTVVANDTAGVANGTARAIDDLTVLADGTTTRRDLSARFAEVFDVHDYGAAGDGVADDTAEIQAALDAAYAAGGGIVQLHEGTYLVTSIARNWAASNISITIRGVGKKATTIQKTGGGASVILDLSGTAPVQEPHFTIEDLRVSGSSKGSHGIRVTRLARFILKNVAVENCDVGLENVGSLIFQCYDITLNTNNYGYRCRKDGGMWANLVQFYGGEIRGNTTWGIDLGECNGIHFYGLDIESNGTAANVNTGALVARSTMDDEIGYGFLSINDCWFEGNLGTTVLIEACSGLSYQFKDTPIISAEGGRALTGGACLNAVLVNVIAGSTNDTVTLTGTNSTIVGGVIHTLNDTSTYRNHINVTTSGGAVPNRSNNAEVSGTLNVSGTTLQLSATTNVVSTGVYSDNARLAYFRDGSLAGNPFEINQTNGAGGNAAACTLRMGCSGTTGRSINAGGTVNASGADYAEFERLSDDCGTPVPGQVVGFDSDGCVTDRYDLSVSFAVVSTAPSFVGGDTFTESDRSTRIAYCGKVPCNVTGAKAGDVISAIRGDDGAIKAAIGPGNPVGKVRSVLVDGRCVIVVRAPGQP